KEALIEELDDRLLTKLSEQATVIDEVDTGIVALDWLNGLRTPDANQLLKGAIEGLDLGSDAPRIFKALVEDTCFGARAIVERFRKEGIPIKGIIELGGVAKKSSYDMQTLANVLDMEIKNARADESCARGAAMFAATASGVFEDVNEAMEAMGSGFGKVYKPEKKKVSTYDELYQQYSSLGAFVEERFE